jgi:hypothetical protein
MMEGWKEDEMESIWKEAASTSSQYHPGIYLEHLSKTMRYLKRAGVTAKIRTERYR